jgi:hypothetical protein
MSPASSGRVVPLRDTTRKPGGERQRSVTRHEEVVRIAETSCEAELTPLGSWFRTSWANAVGKDRELLLRASAGIYLPAVLDETKAARRVRCRNRGLETGKDRRGLREPSGRRREAGDDRGAAIRSEWREAPKTVSSD